MTLRAVFFDVGETLVDEEHYWREVSRIAGVQPHVVWAALGKTIERGEEHWELWRHLGLERPAATAGVVYAETDLHADARPALAEVRASGVLAGVAGNQSSQCSSPRSIVLPRAAQTTCGWTPAMRETSRQ